MKMADKSSTHQKVVKGGHEGWINKDVWNQMVQSGDTNGFHAIVNAPPEVEVFKQKNKEPQVEIETDIVDPNLAGEDRKKPGPKAKA